MKRVFLLVVAILAVGLIVACDRSSSSEGPSEEAPPSTAAQPAPAETPAQPAQPAPAKAPEAAQAAQGTPGCGDPNATPLQVATAFLEANKNWNLAQLLACSLPEDRPIIQQREERIRAMQVVSYELGEATINGDEAQVASTRVQGDGRGGQETTERPVRLRRVDGIWYIR